MAPTSNCESKSHSKEGEDFEYLGSDLDAMAFAENYHDWIADEFEPYLGKSSAEVGAGCGHFSRLMLERGVEQLASFEPAENMYGNLQESLREFPCAKPVNGYFGDHCDAYKESFDSVVYVNVLEHVQHDGIELEHVWKTLKPGGYVLILVPALNWLYSEFDHKLGHYRRYEKNGLESLLADKKFRVEKANYLDMAGVMPWFLMMRMLNRSLSGGNVSAYDKLVIPVVRYLEGKWAPPIGKNLLIVGLKI